MSATPTPGPPTAYGLDNFERLPQYGEIMLNTLGVSVAATILALVFGFLTAWILNRTDVPARRTLEQLMAVPYYVTPLLGALAWSLLGAPESGFFNQLWRAMVGGDGVLFDITGPIGIAWVMALFEGSVAFVMIGAVMKSMDPALEEASQVMGGSKWRTMMRVTLPLVTPGVLGAAIYVFAEMLGSFSAALVLGTPNRFYVITTAMYQLVSQYPPRLPLAAAMGVSLFAVMFLMLFLYRRVTKGRSYVTVGGKAFRPRLMDVGRWRWLLFGVCALYSVLAVFLPVATLIYVALQKLAVAFPAASNFTLDHFRTALSLNAVRSAMVNSLLLGLLTATIGRGDHRAAGLDHPALPPSRPPAARDDCHAAAGGTAVGVRLRHDVGLARVPDPDLRHVLAAADRLPDGVSAARRAHPLQRHRPTRQEPRGVRRDLRRRLVVSYSHHHHAAAASRHPGRLAADLRCQRARARRLHPADGPEQ